MSFTPFRKYNQSHTNKLHWEIKNDKKHILHFLLSLFFFYHSLTFQKFTLVNYGRVSYLTGQASSDHQKNKIASCQIANTDYNALLASPGCKGIHV